MLDAFDSNWIAPLGPHVDAFEREFAEMLGVPAATALSSGTAALHLALVPTLTFVATAGVVRYLGARPVFVDSDASTCNVDPALVDDEPSDRAATGPTPAAFVGIDLYSQCANSDPLIQSCARHRVPIVAAAAESLGVSSNLGHGAGFPFGHGAGV